MLYVLLPSNNDSYSILREEVEAAVKSSKKGKSAEKTQSSNTNGIGTDITIDNKKLETVCTFKYLGGTVSKPEVLSRIALTTAAVTKLKVIWNDKNIAISSKIRLTRFLAMSIFLYAYETWTITADIDRKIQALEMRCFSKLLGI